ncbi:MAG TPA: hypothetical protein VI456_04625 [Polyangia bacterium]
MRNRRTLGLGLALFALAAPAAARAAAKNDPSAEAAPDAGRPTDKSAATPAPAPTAGGNAADETAPPSAPVLDLAKLRAEYDRLRDELFRARARAELVEEGIYASKLGATLRWKGAPDFILHRAEIRLDGNVVWDSGDKPLVDELIKVSERPIKPGPHTVTVKMEVRPGKKGEKEHADLGYESEQTFVVRVPDTGTTTVALTADDDGDLPEYEPEVDMEVKTEK